MWSAKSTFSTTKLAGHTLACLLFLLMLQGSVGPQVASQHCSQDSVLLCITA